MSATIEAQHLYSYQNQEYGERTLLGTTADGSGVNSLSNTVLYWDINGNPQTIFTPSSTASNLRMVDSRDYAFFIDGVTADTQKWNIHTSLTKWGIASPISAPSISPVGSGSITLISGRVYYIAYYNETDQSYSDLSPASASTGALTAQNVSLSDITVSTDPQVSNKLILATADGGDPTTLYEVATIANSATTYTDSTTETILLAANVWQDTDSNNIQHGLFGNQPPPNGSYPTSNNGRIFLAVGEVLWFSKSLSEVTTSTSIIAGRYEECWPPSNQINVSTEAEEIHGLLSDGQTLYIGTEEHIFRLTGDSAQNFSEPQIIFPETGLVNQDVWQLVYLEGTPVGTIWMTPDLRVMSSDFNTYQDIGTPVQTTLNSINPDALDAAWAVMVSNGPYNFYMLAIPTGENIVPDTFCVYDMRLSKWYIWQFADQFLSGIYYTNLAGVPRWVFVDVNGIVRAIDYTATTDRATDQNPISIISTLQTSWDSLGDNMLRKTLNELEVTTSDPDMRVFVQGATTSAQFDSPNNVITDSPMIASPFGDQKVYLAGSPCVDRWYQTTFISVSTAYEGTQDFALTAGQPGSVTSFPITVTAGPTGILVGDVMLLFVISTAPNDLYDPYVNTVVDSAGNSWSTPGNEDVFFYYQKQSFTVGGHSVDVSMCAAKVTTAVAAGGTLDLTVTMNGGATGSIGQYLFINIPGGSAILLSQGRGAGNTPEVTFNSGSAQTSDGYYLSVAYPVAALANFPTGFTPIPGINLTDAGTFIAASYTNSTSASVLDNWQQASSALYVAIEVRFGSITPRTLPSSPDDVILGEYSFEVIPLHRY